MFAPMPGSREFVTPPAAAAGDRLKGICYQAVAKQRFEDYFARK
jgi:hypothetical protein